MSLTKSIKSIPFLYNTGKLVRDITQFELGRVGVLPDIWKVYSNTMLPPARLYNICDAVDAINRERIDGDIAECGVWSGGALALLALRDLAYDKTHRGSGRKYIGFDSFAGLPPPTPDDDDGFEKFKASGRYSESNDARPSETGLCVGASAEEVKSLFARVGIPADRTVFHVGWFQDTVPEAAKKYKNLAILRLDGDWYDSTKVCLDHLYDLVSPGGFLIVDDYGDFSGCRRAIDEFRAARSIQSSIVNVDTNCIYFRKP